MSVGSAVAKIAVAFVVAATSAGCSSSGGPAAGPNLVTLAGAARSVETTAPLDGLTSVHLAGSSTLSGTVEVTDRGDHLGPGVLSAVGPDLAVTGPALALSGGRLRVQPGLVTLGREGGSMTLDLSGASTIAAATISFQPQTHAPANPTATATTVAPPPISLTGPVTVARGSLQLTGTSLRYVDAPADINMTSAEADVSWAGSGSITTATGPIQAQFLGVRAQHLMFQLHRGPETVDVQGTGLALQAFADGVPQLRTTAVVNVSTIHGTTGFLNQKRAFVWTPRNLGSTYDMAILRIRPGNAAAAGVHVGLFPMPPMFGGEPHGLVGGDTTGIKGGVPIESLIARNGDDKRSIGYDAPAGTQMVLIVEGNFDPVTVTVTAY